jgi:hypothetical protein
MYFHTDFTETILFDPWITTSISRSTFTRNLFDIFFVLFFSFYWLMDFYIYFGYSIRRY